MEEKKCTNCSRAPQPIANFINSKGRECSTCEKCREKGKKGDHRPERREYHNELQKDKEYYKVHRAKQLEENPTEFRHHNNENAKKWRKNNPGYIALWNRTSVNARLDSLKRAAQVREIEWNLPDEYAKKMLIEPCVYCGHIDLKVRVNGIDRLDSSKDYSVDNCLPCCKDCNYMKGSYDPKTFIERCRVVASCTFDFPEVTTSTEQKKLRSKK